MILECNNRIINIKECAKFEDKLLGFMFRKEINGVLCFKRCNSIHTFFMFKPIDIIMTDINFNIVYIKRNLKPWKVILPKKNAYYTFEMQPSLINVKLGEKLIIKRKD